MKANIFFNTKINDIEREWRLVAGDQSIQEHPYYGRLRSHMAAVSRKNLAAGLLEINKGPAIAITGMLSDPDIFGADHDWAWEVGAQGQRGRPHPFNIAYSFPQGTRHLPSLDEIIRQAKIDVKKFVEQAYENVKNGQPSYIGVPEQVGFDGAPATYQGPWKQGLDAIAHGKAFTPIIDTGEKIIPFPLSNTLAEKKSPLQSCLTASNSRLALACGASVMLGAALMVHSTIALTRNLLAPREKAASAGGRSNPNDVAPARQWEWSAFELTGGTAMVLLGLLGGHGRGR